MIEFIERNGRTFDHIDGIDATATMIEELTAGQIAENTFFEWVRERIRGP